MDIIKKISRTRIVTPGKAGLFFGKIQLQKFFEHYQVDCVFDVGANNGQYADMLRKHIGYKGSIISFEPIPAAADILREKSKSDPRWYVEEVALDKSAGKKTFNVMQGKQFSSFHRPSQHEVDLFKDKNQVTESISVETSTAKDMFEKYKKIIGFKHPFLKMDTQGHDLEVTQGAGDILKSFVGLQSELSIKKIYDDTPDYMQAIQYYNSRGFELTALIPNNEGHFPQLIEIDCIMYNKNLNAQ